MVNLMDIARSEEQALCQGLVSRRAHLRARRTQRLQTRAGSSHASECGPDGRRVRTAARSRATTSDPLWTAARYPRGRAAPGDDLQRPLRVPRASGGYDALPGGPRPCGARGGAGVRARRPRRDGGRLLRPGARSTDPARLRDDVRAGARARRRLRRRLGKLPRLAVSDPSRGALAAGRRSRRGDIFGAPGHARLRRTRGARRRGPSVPGDHRGRARRGLRSAALDAPAALPDDRRPQRALGRGPLRPRHARRPADRARLN